MTKIKICGLMRPEDAVLAAELGADFLGFIFAKESPRYVSSAAVSAAAAQASRLRCKIVGVFRNESAEEIERIAREAQLDYVQIHNITRVDFPTIRAFHVKDTLPDTTTDAKYVLFDTGGGTGRTFDWTLLEDYPRTKPFFLAGGITPDNVAAAIDAVQPFAIDLASGIESSPGIKDHHKMRLLFERVKR